LPSLYTQQIELPSPKAKIDLTKYFVEVTDLTNASNHPVPFSQVYKAGEAQDGWTATPARSKFDF